MSRTTRKLIGIAPDGTEVSIMTSGDYDVAGIVKNRAGNWSIVAKGVSSESVRRRTLAYFNRSPRMSLVAWDLVPLMEDIPQQLKDYFPGKQMFSLRIKHLFSPGAGWFTTAAEAENTTAAKGIGARPSRKMLRWLKRDGYTHIGIGIGNQVADFSLEELTKIDRRPALGGSLVGSRTR
jgi:hypothetical protein